MHPIKICFSLYDDYLCILNNKVINYENTGCFENKYWGNDRLTYDVLKDFPVELIPEGLRDATARYVQTYRAVDKEQEYYTPEEGLSLVFNRLYKDIAGVWGPTNWSYLKGTHVGFSRSGDGYTISPVVIGECYLQEEVQLNAEEMLLFTLNSFHLGHMFWFHALNEAVRRGEDTTAVREETVEWAVKNTSVENSEFLRAKLELFESYTRYLSAMLAGDELPVQYVASLNGMSVLALLGHIPQVQDLLSSVIGDSELTPWTYVVAFVSGLLLELNDGNWLGKTALVDLYEELSKRCPEIPLPNGCHAD